MDAVRLTKLFPAVDPFSQFLVPGVWLRGIHLSSFFSISQGYILSDTVIMKEIFGQKARGVAVVSGRSEHRSFRSAGRCDRAAGGPGNPAPARRESPRIGRPAIVAPTEIATTCRGGTPGDDGVRGGRRNERNGSCDSAPKIYLTIGLFILCCRGVFGTPDG